MCDPATGWFEITEIRNKSAKHIAELVDRTWFSRYPRPLYCIFDNGNEFLGKEFQEMLSSYGIQTKPTTIKNPQANYVERVHQTLGNMLRTMELENVIFDTVDPWSGILANCAWAIRSTAHSIMEATPAQLVFRRDMLFDLPFKVKWRDIKKKRQAAQIQNKRNENSKRDAHTYKVVDRILLNKGEINRKLTPKRIGPYAVTRVYQNGTIKIQKGSYAQKVSIRRCSPYYS